MISETFLIQVLFIAGFFAFLLLYVNDGHRFFFRKIPSFETARTLATIRKAVLLVTAATTFLALVVITLYLLGV